MLFALTPSFKAPKSLPILTSSKFVKERVSSCTGVKLLFSPIYIQHTFECPCPRLILERASTKFTNYKTEVYLETMATDFGFRPCASKPIEYGVQIRLIRTVHGTKNGEEPNSTQVRHRCYHTLNFLALQGGVKSKTK